MQKLQGGSVPALAAAMSEITAQLNDPSIHGPIGTRIGELQSELSRIGASLPDADLTHLAAQNAARVTSAETALAQIMGEIEVMRGDFQRAIADSRPLGSAYLPSPGAYPGSEGCKDGRPRLMKLKESRPKEGGFGGDRVSWREFRDDVINWASGAYPQVEEFLDWGWAHVGPVKLDDVIAELGSEADDFGRQFRRELWSFLKPDSEAREVIKHTSPSEGLEAWRLLGSLCAPKSGYRVVADVQGILSPATAANLNEVVQKLARWETSMTKRASGP